MIDLTLGGPDFVLPERFSVAGTLGHDFSLQNQVTLRTVDITRGVTKLPAQLAP